ncbi:MAG: SusC/RagA family TonB-linked outer membrane protein [Mangrovibacterium sp.]
MLKKTPLQYSLILLLTFMCYVSLAQNMISVSGKVTDKDGQSIPGVTVVHVGTHHGTVTNIDGDFMLTDVKIADVLEFSFIGMKSIRIPIQSQNINAVLEIDVLQVEEVVSVGYGTQQKKDLTGAVSTIGSKLLAQTPSSDLAMALQGRLAGVSVSSQDGRPGAKKSIRIRGGGSISQSNEPLLIVDGFPVDEISSIPVEQIESVSVLKDAASTAIYGASGANGVILVTTKNAKEGDLDVTYNGYLQINTPAKHFKALSAQQYLLHTWSYASALGSSYQNGVEKYFGLGSNNGNHFNDYKDVNAHDYSNDILRTAFGQNHNFTVTGGTKKTKMYLNLGHLEDKGIQIQTGYRQSSATFKVEQRVTDNFKINAEAFMYRRHSENEVEEVEYKGSIPAAAYMYRPIDNPLGNAEDVSSFANGSEFVDAAYNPVKQIKNNTNYLDRQYLRAFIGLTANLHKNVSLYSEFTLSDSHEKSYDYNNGLIQQKEIAINNADGLGYRWLTTLDYKLKMKNDTKLAILMGSELRGSSLSTNTIKGLGFPNSFNFQNAVGLINSASTTSVLNTEAPPSKVASFFGRANYSVFEKYLFTATFRADGSSKFAPNHQWGMFPSMAIAWRMNNEKWLVNSSWVNNLKLRLSWGYIGSDNINPSLWRESWVTVDATSIGYEVDGKNNSVLMPKGQLENPDLKWETTLSRNIGIDYSFFNNRWSGSLEAYWNETRDLLMEVDIDATTGYSTQFQNFGQTSNKGFEAQTAIQVVQKNDFNFSTTLIYNFNRNNIDKLNGDYEYIYNTDWAASPSMPRYDYVVKEGRAIGVVRGFIGDGFYQVDDFDYIDGKYVLKSGIADFSNIGGNHPHPFKTPTGQGAYPGAVKFKNVDGNNVIDANDYTIIGEMQARHTGSISLDFKYKNFDLNALFNWSYGGKIYNATGLISSFGNKDYYLGANRLDFVSNAFKAYNVDSDGQLYAVTNPDELKELNKNAQMGLPYYERGVTYDRFIEDASFLRLASLSIGYSIPNNWAKKVKLTRARVYLSASNLFCLTNYSGLDPEINARADYSGLPQTNLDFGSYPRAKSFILGMNVSF